MRSRRKTCLPQFAHFDWGIGRIPSQAGETSLGIGFIIAPREDIISSREDMISLMKSYPPLIALIFLMNVNCFGDRPCLLLSPARQRSIFLAASRCRVAQPLPSPRRRLRTWLCHARPRPASCTNHASKKRRSNDAQMHAQLFAAPSLQCHTDLPHNNTNTESVHSDQISCLPASSIATISGCPFADENPAQICASSSAVRPS